MITAPKPDKWERRRQRQAFLNRCASLKKIEPQLTPLASRKIWDRAAALAQSEIAQRTQESDSAVQSSPAQSQITEHNHESQIAVANS